MVVSLVAAMSACGDGGADSCEEMRAEHERMLDAEDPMAAWSDIQALQHDVAERLALENRIEDRCT